MVTACVYVTELRTLGFFLHVLINRLFLSWFYLT